MHRILSISREIFSLTHRYRVPLHLCSNTTELERNHRAVSLDHRFRVPLVL